MAMRRGAGVFKGNIHIFVFREFCKVASEDNGVAFVFLYCGGIEVTHLTPKAFLLSRIDGGKDD